MTETVWQGLYITRMALRALLFIAWSCQPRGVPASEYLNATAPFRYGPGWRICRCCWGRALCRWTGGPPITPAISTGP